VQRVPVVVLMFVIRLYKEKKTVNLNNEEEEDENEENLPNMDDGPNGRAKLFLLIATIFNFCGDFPLEVWSDALPSGI
jgi:hypothetical protein